MNIPKRNEASDAQPAARYAIIVQARVGSTRLPGKTLLPLNGRTVIEEVLARCCAVPGVDVVVCAIPDGSAQDELVAAVARTKAVVTRGSEKDVLARYISAAKAVAATHVMRITSDCPLIDPQLCRRVLDALTEPGAEYACNNMPRTFPHGLDCEAFTMAALLRAGQAADGPEDREHVTPWLRRNAVLGKTVVSGLDASVARHRWTLDYAEDHAFLNALFARLPKGVFGWRDVLAIVESEHEIARINACRAVG
jgi:spore coat polysaccharide biosynthesis protein SpsF